MVTINSAGKVKIKGAGTAKVTIRAEKTRLYEAASKTITIKINKAANPLNVKGKTAKIKAKNKNQTLKVTKVIRFKKKGQGTMSYSLVSAAKGGKSYKKYFKVNKKTGKVTVKKGLAKGNYTLKLKVKAGGNTNYKASKVKTVSWKIKIQ